MIKIFIYDSGLDWTHTVNTVANMLETDGYKGRLMGLRSDWNTSINSDKRLGRFEVLETITGYYSDGRKYSSLIFISDDLIEKLEIKEIEEVKVLNIKEIE